MTLNDVKAGDEVIYLPSGGWVSPKVATVQRVTPTQIIIEYGQRFWKRNGDAVGSADRWSTPSIKVATPEKLAAIREHERRNTLARNIRQAEYSRLSTDQLERIWAILRERAAEAAESEGAE